MALAGTAGLLSWRHDAGISVLVECGERAKVE